MYISKMTSPLFIEKIPLNKWTTIIIGIFIAVLTPLSILQVFAFSKDPTLLVVFACMDLFFILILLNFKQQTTEIDNESIKVSFGLIRKRILIDDLLACEPIQAKLGVYTGNGIRVGGDGSLAFLVSMGEAVKLRRRSGRSFVFSTRRQAEVIRVMNELIERRGASSFKI